MLSLGKKRCYDARLADMTSINYLTKNVSNQWKAVVWQNKQLTFLGAKEWFQNEYKVYGTQKHGEELSSSQSSEFPPMMKAFLSDMEENSRPWT